MINTFLEQESSFWFESHTQASIIWFWSHTRDSIWFLSRTRASGSDSPPDQPVPIIRVPPTMNTN